MPDAGGGRIISVFALEAHTDDREAGGGSLNSIAKVLQL